MGRGGGKSLNDYKTMSVSGRQIHVYAPSGLKENSPLLISCHGMDQDPNYQQSNTHWEAVADTAGFVVVYPRGGTGMNTWDIQGDKDTKWMTEIIAQMEKDYKINTKRVYLSGFSMGGVFTYHSMSKIAAFAPTSGTNVFGASKAQRPVPIIHPHGTNDAVAGTNMKAKAVTARMLSGSRRCRPSHTRCHPGAEGDRVHGNAPAWRRTRSREPSSHRRHVVASVSIGMTMRDKLVRPVPRNVNLIAIL